MQAFNKSSRRSFVGKIATSVLGTVVGGAASAKILAGKIDEHKISNRNQITEGFISDKKFVPVMITPYKQNGQIDFDGVSRLMDFYLAAGVKGFFANCASSEMYSLTPDERLALTRHVVKRVNGAVSVVATGSFGDAMEEKAEFAKKIYHTGVNAVITITSHFAKADESDDILIKNYEKFFSLTDNIPMGTYECPSPYKRILTPYSFKYLLSTGRMIYHKDTTIDFDKVKAKIEMAKNTRLEFYDACIANAMYSLQAGAKGMSAICGNFYPEIVAWMCNNATDTNKQEDVKYIQSQLTKTEDIIGNNYPLSAKYFLHKRGLPIEVISRVNANPLTDKEKKILDETYAVLLEWCKRIGIEPTHV
ncbi:MAG: dihydrodipicolinate synthase family protein [Bacteroidetes bacterium]|nr:dihydrodipicolinate synthase family protein [Bacteroidota bacterium]